MLAAFPNSQVFDGVSDTFTGITPQGAFSKLRMFHYLAPVPSSFFHVLQQISDASSLSDISFVTQGRWHVLNIGTLFQRLQLRPETITSFYLACSTRRPGSGD